MESQKELFGEFEDSNGKRPLFQKGFLPEKTVAITLTYDKLILIILGSLAVLAITFAFGFERGRASLLKSRAAVVIPRPKTAAPPVRLPAQPAPLPKRPYTIQVATFKSKEFALKETEALKKRGFSVTIIGINGLYEVWAGEYTNEKEASQALNTLKKIYKDCRIRKR